MRFAINILRLVKIQFVRWLVLKGGMMRRKINIKGNAPYGWTREDLRVIRKARRAYESGILSDDNFHIFMVHMRSKIKDYRENKKIEFNSEGKLVLV